MFKIWIQNDFSITLNLISEENGKTGKVLESQATQLDRLESNAQVYQSRDKEVKQRKSSSFKTH